jgi:hypothetical protein
MEAARTGTRQDVDQFLYHPDGGTVAQGVRAAPSASVGAGVAEVQRSVIVAPRRSATLPIVPLLRFLFLLSIPHAPSHFA